MKIEKPNKTIQRFENGTLLAVSALLVAFGISALFGGTVPIVSNQEIEIEQKPSPFVGIDLEASATVVWDVNNQKVLFSKNGQAQLPLASIAKLMTALVATDKLQNSSVVLIEGQSLAEEGDTGLFMEERWRLGELLGFMLLVSSNDAASAVAAAVGALSTSTTIASTVTEKYQNNKTAFVYFMNQKASEIGLTQTYFLNETGLDASFGTGGAYGSAKDMALLLEYAIVEAPEVVDLTRYSSFIFSSLSNIRHSVRNTNDSVNNIPGLIASKTGYTELAGGNLVFAFDAGINHPIIVSILGSTQEGRFVDAEKLVAASLKAIAQ
ncbi:D-alanyl-D-alanine carboxypeptidase [Patescibacteria group bacterium]|nr:D-alanyl-D-alanine carboxypeptidase [Patescibacteria group bacterium]